MKYLKMFGKIVLYFMVYILTTFVCTFIYAIIYGISNLGNLNAVSFNAAILKNVFTLTAAAAIITFGIYVLMFRKKEINLFHRCKLKKINFEISLIIALSSLGLSLFSSSLVNILINIFPSYNEASAAIESNMSSVLGVISVVLIIPILEEVLFRGLIYNELKTHLNIVIAIILQSLIFAIAHGNMLQGIYAFIMGAVVAIIYDKTGSIFAPILFHVMYNLLGSIILPIILSGANGYYLAILIVGAIITTLSLIILFKNNTKKITNDTLYTQI
ncbi:lysostaphin resistance A-like protein [Clostridium sp.]|jgi:membrane protease YdiL (CAAX protease family)|uniref:CPBP family intramembrane glutamic endopeptidase n=1 Tax=Clostridium sp. TaxID=1506 RepID=UPI003EF057B0